MKKIISLFMVVLMIFSVGACGTEESQNAGLTDDVDVVASPSVISPGNVQQLAGRLWWKM